MFNFYEKDGKIVVTTKYNEIPDEFKQASKTSRDFINMSDAVKLMDRLNEEAGEKIYLAIDRGEWVAPRYDIIEMPKVGDEVSYSFNGDSYPCGTIVRITKTLQIVTSDGKRFTYKNGGWKYYGTWSLIKGHHRTWNPEF